MLVSILFLGGPWESMMRASKGYVDDYWSWLKFIIPFMFIIVISILLFTVKLINDFIYLFISINLCLCNYITTQFLIKLLMFCTIGDYFKS